jgi:hypothetical protein
VKYINLISHNFEKFKKKNDYLWNVRCPFCGDSRKNLNKMRGFFFRKENNMIFKCHNCGHGASMNSVLKELAPNLHKEYCLEKFGETQNKKKTPTWTPQGSDWTPNGHKLFDDKPVVPPKFEPKFSLFYKLCDRLDSLPYDHEAVKYVKSRNIPNDKWDRLYYINNIKDIVQLNDKYQDSIVTDEPRLVIPFFDHNGELMSVSLRGMRGESLRYILVKIQEDAPTVFGLDKVDLTKTVSIVEGPLDSLFLENSIACAGTSFNKIEQLNIQKDKITIVIDNQPRNVEVMKVVEKYVELDYNVVIWPESIVQKDINDMYDAGIDVADVINSNTHSGLTAKFLLNQWKKC